MYSLNFIYIKKHIMNYESETRETNGSKTHHKTTWGGFKLSLSS